MYSMQSDGIQKISPDDAVQLLKINTFPGQRPLNQKKVSHYIFLADSGRMRPVPIDIAVLPSGKRVLMNGQHSLSMIIARNKPHRAIVTRWKCETDEDVWRLFSSFDTHSTRTERTIMGAASGLFGDSALREVNKRILSKCGTALLIVGGVKESQAVPEPYWGTCDDKSKKAELVNSNPEPVKFVASLWAGEIDNMFRVGVVAAIIATWRVAREDAYDFWYRTLNSDGVKKGSPEWNLHRAITNGATGAFRGRDAQKYDYIHSICWWNEWRLPESKRKIVKAASMATIPKAK